MDLIIAVVLGAILFGKCASDRTKGNRRRKEVETKAQIVSAWKTKVRDLNLEYQLREFISRPENKEKVLEEVSEVYDKIFANGRPLSELWPTKYWIKRNRKWTAEDYERLDRGVCYMFSPNALRIMMARRGKICDLDITRSSYKAMDSKEEYFPNGQPRIKSAGIFGDIPVDAYVLMWCADELKKHGVNGTFKINVGPYGYGNGYWDLSE